MLLQQITKVRKLMNFERWKKNVQLIKTGEANVNGWHRDVLLGRSVNFFQISKRSLICKI